MRKRKGETRCFSLFFLVFALYGLTAMASISTSAPLGRAAACIAQRAGHSPVKYLPYTSLTNAEIADIDHKHGRLDNVLSLAASRLEHREQILDALLRLLGRAAGNKCAGRRVQRKLAGDKYKTVCFDRLGVGADGAGGSGRRNHMLHGKILLYQCIFIITSCAICVKYSYSWKNGRN